MKDVLGVVLALLLVVGCGYPRPADLSIVVPETGTTISHHRPLEFAVDLRDADAASFAIEIDGVPASELRIASSSGLTAMTAITSLAGQASRSQRVYTRSPYSRSMRATPRSPLEVYPWSSTTRPSLER